MNSAEAMNAFIAGQKAYGPSNGPAGPHGKHYTEAHRPNPHTVTE